MFVMHNCFFLKYHLAIFYKSIDEVPTLLAKLNHIISSIF